MNASAPAAKVNPWSEPATRNYLAIGLAAAVILGLALADRGAGMWAVIVCLLAGTGLVFRWSGGPVFVVLGAAISLMVTHNYGVRDIPPADAVLAASLLGYCLAQFRLMGLTHAHFPPDPRRLLDRHPPAKPGLPAWFELLMALTLFPYLIYLLFRPRRKRPTPVRPGERRSAASAAPDEVPRALLTIALVTVGVMVVWVTTDVSYPPFRVTPEQWQIGLVLWILLAAGLAARCSIAYAAGRMQSLPEARMALQEVLFREIRREQRRGARWVAAAVVRRDNEPS